MSVRHALLALVSEGPKYGLQLREEFEARTGEVWPLNVGQVYTTLQRLERDGFVASDGVDEGAQKGYEITADGRDELLIKVLVAAEVPGVDVREVIQVHRRQLMETMQRYTSVKAQAGDGEVALALVVDAELFRMEAAVRWLDSADARLRLHPDALRGPTPAPGRPSRLAAPASRGAR